MRPIKFRGKRFEGVWVHGYYIPLPSKRYDAIIVEPLPNHKHPWGRHVVELATIGQYTGLQDKNGVEIYEGDILGGSLGGVVAWVPSEARFGISLGGEIHEVYFEELAQSELEVIGNIHDLEEIGEYVSQTLP